MRRFPNGKNDGKGGEKIWRRSERKDEAAEVQSLLGGDDKDVKRKKDKPGDDEGSAEKPRFFLRERQTRENY